MTDQKHIVILSMKIMDKIFCIMCNENINIYYCRVLAENIRAIAPVALTASGFEADDETSVYDSSLK